MKVSVRGHRHRTAPARYEGIEPIGWWLRLATPRAGQLKRVLCALMQRELVIRESAR